MTSTPPPSRLPDLLTGAVLATIPWIAFLVAIVLADMGHGDRSGSLAGAVRIAPLCLGFVALPSFLPLAVARSWAMRLVVLGAMTAVAAAAAVLGVTSDDAQAGLAVLLVAEAAIPLTAVVWVGQAVAARRKPTEASAGAGAGADAALSDRLAALTIDVVIIGAVLGAVLVAPLDALSDTGHEVGAVVAGVGVATGFLGALVAGRGRTVGQWALGLAVVDARTRGRVSLGKALLRSLVVVLEVAATPTLILAVPAVVEASAVAAGGRSLTDRLLGTSVVTTR